MGVDTQNRERVRSLLNRAHVEIGSALNRVDTMGDFELAEAAGASEATRAFFDFNGSCGASATGPAGSRNDPKAFFDFNGSCGGAGALDGLTDGDRGAVLVRALREIIR